MEAVTPLRDATVRKVSWAYREPVCATLARAFHDDPAFVHIFPDAATRRRRLPRFFDMLWALTATKGVWEGTEGLGAAAIWLPPGRWRTSPITMIGLMPRLIAVHGLATGRALKLLDQVDRVHPDAPHWYLAAIGTDPDRQGRGLGGAVLRAGLKRVDAAGLPAYLESSKQSNIPLYRHFGFEPRDPIQIDGGPTVYPMWRPAQAAPPG